MSLSAGIFYSSVVVAFVLAFGIGANDVANRYWLHATAAAQIAAASGTAEGVPFGHAALVPQLAAEL